MYNISDLFINFTEDELYEGAALYFSGNFSYKKKALPLNAQVIELTASFPSNTLSPIKTTVKLDPENHDLMASSCSCGDFDTIACRHTVALQLAWMKDEHGIDALKNSPLKELLSKRSGVPDPFAEGAMRRTTSSLSSLLQKKNGQMNRGVPAISQSDSGKMLSLEVHLDSFAKRRIELKVREKRSYVVKSIPQFISAFDRHKVLTFGKNLEFSAYKEKFDPASAALIDFLHDLLEDHKMDDKNTGFFGSRYYDYAQDERTMVLNGMEVDLLAEKFEQEPIFVYNGNSIRFNNEPFRVGVSIFKKEYGAVLEIGKMTALAKTPSWDYFLSDGEIRRMEHDEGSGLDELMAMASSQEELFLSEKDCQPFLQTFLPVLIEKADVVGKGFELAEYLPEVPKFVFKLDLPQPDLITCSSTAVYSDREFPLGETFQADQCRNAEVEKNVTEKLSAIFNAYYEEKNQFCYYGDEEGIFSFLTERMPGLSDLGEVLFSDRIQKIRVRKFSKFDVGVSVEEGILALRMASDVFSEQELIEIMSSFTTKRKYFRLKSGAFIQMDGEQEELLAALSEVIRGGRKPKEAEWKLPLFRAVYLDLVLRDREEVAYHKSRDYKHLVSKVRDAGENRYDLPAELETVLRDYQKDGFSWIKTLKEYGFGGILADDMGLGKTLQVIAFFASEKASGKSGDEMRSLVITPASLVYNWKKEIEKFAPSLTVKMVVGALKERKEVLEEDAEDADVWITSYDLLKRDFDKYEKFVFANEIIDEAQYVKNQTTGAAKSIRTIQSSFRLALTGTPIENKLSELWSIFDYLMPGFLYSSSRFRAEFEIPVLHSKSEEALQRLRAMVHPFILRRLKKDVLTDLPDKIEEDVLTELSGRQRELYDAHAQRLKMKLTNQNSEDFANSKIEILSELTKMRQLCCGPELLVEDYHGENAKLDACMELVAQAVEGGHKALIFSQFTSALDLIGERLAAEKIAYFRIDGSVTKEERIRLVDAFSKDETPIFLVSLKAGGTGLNLTAADIVIHYDPWWNLAAQNQATDRTHRIGQKNIVTVYSLIASGTVEEKIQLLQRSKQKLADDVLMGEGISSILIDRDAVMDLL